MRVAHGYVMLTVAVANLSGPRRSSQRIRSWNRRRCRCSFSGQSLIRQILMQQLSATVCLDCQLLHLMLWISVHRSDFRLVQSCNNIYSNCAAIARHWLTDPATAGSNSGLSRSATALGLHKQWKTAFLAPGQSLLQPKIELWCDLHCILINFLGIWNEENLLNGRKRYTRYLVSKAWSNNFF